MYIKLTNGTPTKYTIGQLRRDNPNTSFPKRVSDETLVEWNVYPCALQDVAEINNDTHEIVNGNIEQVDGVWTQLRSIQQQPFDDVAKVMRRKRDNLIAETDYLALSDNTLTEAMATYRQALRDITDHANFPYLEDADWPVKP
jgi:hypothetical protein